MQVISSVVSKMPGYIHHVEWCVKDIHSQVNKLITQFGFQIVGHRIRHIPPKWQIRQIIVQSGATVFILTEKSRLLVYDENKMCKWVW